nr:cupin-like domain-containing protein [Acidimicrobiia bacterium]
MLARGARPPFFRLVRGGTTLPASATSRSAGVGHRTIDDVVQPNAVVKEFHAGATLVVQGLQFTNPHLARAANNLALELDHAVQVNAYLSPEAARGLELHFDYHDVFVLQLDGRKRWRVWEPLERTHRPLKGVAPAIAAPTFDELGEPSLDLMLEAGDCLYLPRGFPHCAETVESASTHLTIGLMAVTWQRAVHHAVEAAAATDDGLRASVAARSLDHGVVAPAVDAVEAQLNPVAVRAWMAAEIWRRQPATRLRPIHPPPIDAASAV